MNKMNGFVESTKHILTEIFRENLSFSIHIFLKIEL